METPPVKSGVPPGGDEFAGPWMRLCRISRRAEAGAGRHQGRGRPGSAGRQAHDVGRRCNERGTSSTALAVVEAEPTPKRPSRPVPTMATPSPTTTPSGQPAPPHPRRHRQEGTVRGEEGVSGHAGSGRPQQDRDHDRLGARPLFLSSVNFMGEIKSKVAPRLFRHINENVVMRPSDAATGCLSCVRVRVTPLPRKAVGDMDLGDLSFDEAVVSGD